ncbi:MAG: hypothetical protein ACYCSF_00970 [Acidimicrobiales bacterium]
MTDAATTPTGATGATTVARKGAFSRMLWYRQLDAYPNTGPRFGYLAIVVLATTLLYYELYVAGTVSTDIIAQYHMSFLYYVYISVAGNAWGRSDLCSPDWPIAGDGRTWLSTASASPAC